MTALHINHETREASLDGRDLTLGARAFDVLAFLFTHADRVVTKTELLDHVWSGLMVEESNLTVQIAALRKALGREAIKTVPGVGYKFTLDTRGDRFARPQTRNANNSVSGGPALRQSHRG